ncbi:6-bladed beta-propeller [bacterium]|nr:6-bladed beta-propeller [bacterium]
MNFTVINGHRLMQPVLLLIVMLCALVQAQEIVTENGIRYIKNKHSIQGASSDIELKYIRTYGGLDAEDESEILYYPYDIAIDSLGSLYILDIKGPCVAVYDDNGNAIRKIGRKGEGPGEFAIPKGLDIGVDNNLYVSEWKARFIHVLTLKGDYIRKFRPEISLDFPGFKFISNGDIVCGTKEFFNFVGDTALHREPVFSCYSSTGLLKRQFGEIIQFKDRSMTKTGNAVFYTIDEHDNIYAAFRFQNRIEKYDSLGCLQMKITRRIRYKMPYDVELCREHDSDGYIMSISLPILNVVSCGIGVDTKGRIWVMTLSRQPAYQKFCSVEDGEVDYLKLEIYSSDGVLTQEIAINDDLNPAESCLYIFGDKLFMLNSNETAVHEYLIVN